MSIYKSKEGRSIQISGDPILDHNDLANRNEYGAHNISAIRKLPEKLASLKNQIDEKQPIQNAYNNIDKIKDYLYQLEYTTIDYNYAKEYFKNNYDVTPSACSSVRLDRFYGRNLDWTYNNNAEFIVKTKSLKNKYATLSVCTGIEKLSNEFVDSCEYSELYKIIPFYVDDGINEKGVFCNINIVPTDKGLTTETTPLIEQKEELNIRMIPRFILDNFSSAIEAITYIKNYVKLTAPKKLQEMGYEAHFMVGDETSTYCLEIVNNKIVYQETNALTNFYLNGVTFNQDGSVYTPETQSGNNNAVVANHITPYGAGLERWNLINSYLNSHSTGSKENLEELMHQLYYTRAYKGCKLDIGTSNPYWYTEFVGKYDSLDLKCNSNPLSFTPVINKANEEYLNRSRENSLTWQTVHSSVYDIQEKLLYIKVQETNEEIIIGLNKDSFTSTGVFKYKGSVEKYSDLPSTSEIGDVYNIKTADKSHNIKAGDNVVWNGNEWDVLSGIIDVDNKLDKVTKTTEKDQLYGKLADGTQIMFDLPDIIDENSQWEAGEGTNSVVLKNSDSLASGELATAEGFRTRARGKWSHTEGCVTKTADPEDAPAIANWREGTAAHAEGEDTRAYGNYSHAEGANTSTNNPTEHAEGRWNISHMASTTWGDAGNTINSIGIGTTLDNRKNAFEVMQNGDTYILGVGNYDGTNVNEAKTLQEVLDLNIENGTGVNSLQQKQDGNSGVFDFTNKNPNATALDNTLTGNIPYGAIGNFAVSLGGKGQASGKRAFQTGTTTIAKGNYSFSSGDNSVALADDSFAGNYKTVAAGIASFSIGYETQAIGPVSFVSGTRNKVEGGNAAAFGNDNVASHNNQFVIGYFNNNKIGTLFEVGSGVSNSNRSNAFEVYSDGHAEVQTQGTTPNSVVINSELDRAIEEVKNNPDVRDIVQTKQDLDNYDKSILGNNDIIRVLIDNTHDNASTFYKYDKPNLTWNYIGQASDSYTKEQADNKFVKQETRTGYRVYVHTPTGDDTVNYAQSAIAGDIPQRTTNGNIAGPAANKITDNSWYVTKEFVDTETDKKLNKINEANKIYATDSSNNQTSILYVPDNITAWSIVQRNGNGSVLTNDVTIDDTVATDNYAVNKKTVKGALDGKLNSSTAKNIVYINNDNGTPVVLSYSYDKYAQTFAVRGTNGTLVVGTPTASSHATTKEYVDNGFVAKSNAAYNAVYTRNGTDGDSVVAYYNCADNDNYPQSKYFLATSSTGRLSVNDPVQPHQCANKKYVDENGGAELEYWE